MTTKRVKEPKPIKATENSLQFYARANAPSRDYYGLTITDAFITLNIWKVSYGPHTMPKQRVCSLEEFPEDKTSQDEVKSIFGEGIFDYLVGLSQKKRKLENLPRKLFVYLLRFLPIEDILSLMCCSRIVYEMCNQEEVWRMMFMKKFRRAPSKEEKLLALDSCWKEIFKRRLIYVRKALRESADRKMKMKLEMKKSVHSVQKTARKSH